MQHTTFIAQILHIKLFTVPVLCFHHCPCFLIHCHHCYDQPFFNPQLPQRPPNYFSRYHIKRFLQIHKCKISFLPETSPASAVQQTVPIPGMNPNCIPSIHTFSLNLLSKTLSNTFIPCSSNFIGWCALHSNGSTFPLYTCSIRVLSSQSLRHHIRTRLKLLLAYYLFTGKHKSSPPLTKTLSECVY